MRQIVPSSHFKRDLKRLHKKGYELALLTSIVDVLATGVHPSIQNRPHKLKGEYAGYWECHIEHDWLLIYGIEKEAVLLVRTGSHPDLFE